MKTADEGTITALRPARVSRKVAEVVKGLADRDLTASAWKPSTARSGEELVCEGGVRAECTDSLAADQGAYGRGHPVSTYRGPEGGGRTLRNRARGKAKIDADAR